MRKVAIIGGGGIRTPLIIHALSRSEAELNLGELALFDVDSARTEIMAGLGREIAARLGARFSIQTGSSLDAVAADADFILNSIRVGGMAARARDERIAIEHGLAGQETTGSGGAAMALRTLPVTLAHARIVERVAPRSWFINFSNPAGLVTQALQACTGLNAIGICDTPSELFHRIAETLRSPRESFTFEYAGLNHLGWIRRVMQGREDVMARLLANAEALRNLYPADLFDPVLIQTLGLIPSEYLFFYYSQRRAYQNQLRAGASRGEDLQRLNADLLGRLQTAGPGQGIEIYRDYLLRRNASYLKLEAQAESAAQAKEEHYDPFETATGYHRIALDVMRALLSDHPREVVVNVRNEGAIEDLGPDDVVEVPCDIDRNGARPRRTGRLPDSVRGLVIAVKAYERTIIRAAVERSAALARLALLEYPIVGQWEIAGDLLSAMIAADPQHLAYLR